MEENLSANIKVADQDFRAIFYPNPTSRSLIDQMPFTVEIEDYAGIEKIFYPTEGLSKEGAPEGASPSAGDIMYYAPWGDVAIFYKDFKYSSGLIPMGKINDLPGFLKALTNFSSATFTNIKD
ncbi:cyclophilin-like fold protein [uncultured Algoriphagus sp.]|uniref:cyclophilin-like fold protein n=1 Tax=Algoriphagus formosus TaxID=2007308 RepID=UPI0025841C05|nr:cyclophilin-like fold protein [uncultured Algoriphagus sp.]